MLSNYHIFDRCGIQDLNFPKATTIGSKAFYWCSELQNVNLPLVTSIGDEAFIICPKIVNVTMGTVAPTLGTKIFGTDLSTARTITVKVPSETTGYTPFTGTLFSVSGTDTTANWANGFRGGGWNGSGFVPGSVYINSGITLIIQSQ
ncbi:leucine-rich repeat protein [Treponema sp. R6D11]